MQSHFILDKEELLTIAELKLTCYTSYSCVCIIMWRCQGVYYDVLRLEYNGIYSYVMPMHAMHAALETPAVGSVLV